MRVSSLTSLALVAALLHLGCGGGQSGVSNEPAGSVDLGERATFEGISFEVPSTWVPETPSGRMRRAQYRIDHDGSSAECALFHFAGGGGSVEANLQRWYGQFTQPDGSSTADSARVESFEAGGMRVTQVQVTGTYEASMGPAMGATAGPQTGYAMAAGVIETPNGPWFLKCIGPETAIESAAPGLRALLESAQPGGQT